MTQYAARYFGQDSHGSHIEARRGRGTWTSAKSNRLARCPPSQMAGTAPPAPEALGGHPILDRGCVGARRGYSVPERERILVAMSGGVDSSVAALVLKRQGHDITGAYMKNWINEDGVVGNCPWMQDIEDARRVADQVGIPFQVVNLMREYREKVVQYLLDGYSRGLTPNPDVMCNREIKFGVFRAWASEHGFTALATGHHAQRRIAADGAAEILEGADANKDQSYFLALLGQDQVMGARAFPSAGSRSRNSEGSPGRRGSPRRTRRTARASASSARSAWATSSRPTSPDLPGRHPPRIRRARARAPPRPSLLHAGATQGHWRPVKH